MTHETDRLAALDAAIQMYAALGDSEKWADKIALIKRTLQTPSAPADESELVKAVERYIPWMPKTTVERMKWSEHIAASDNLKSALTKHKQKSAAPDYQGDVGETLRYQEVAE